MIHVAAIHGVNHSEEEQQTFYEYWQECLERAGLKVEVHPLAWSSLDSPIADWLATWGNPAVWQGHLMEIERGIHMRSGLIEWERMTRGESRLLLGHSWGTVLGYYLKATSSYLDDVPMVGMGSPYTHGYIGRRLKWAKRGPSWVSNEGRRPVFVQNKDDNICVWKPLLNMELTVPAPTYTKTYWIDVDAPQQERWTGEHGVELYLGHPETARLIKTMSPAIVGA